jgi:ABC-type amino acid transport system permease subunit
MSKFKPVKAVSKTFVWIVRGIPLMLQIFIIYYVPGLVFKYPMFSYVDKYFFLNYGIEDTGRLIAVLIAIFDILPVVGSGLVIVPWVIICFIIGDIGAGVGLFVLWAVLCVVRQIIEPKIVGNSVGMHPFLTLFAMLAGNFIYGGIGILLLPVAIALCQSLNSAGVVHFYKTAEPEPKENDPLSEVITKGVDAAGVWITRPFKKKLKAKKRDSLKNNESESNQK